MRSYKVRIQEIGKPKYLEAVVQAHNQAEAQRIGAAQYSGYTVLSASEMR
jgi:hypothetical protein